MRPQPPKLSQLPLAEAKSRLYREMLWTESRDVFCLRLDPIWADFYGAKSVGKTRPVPLLDALPVTIWLYRNPEVESGKSNVPGYVPGLLNERRKRYNPFDTENEVIKHCQIFLHLN